MSRNSRQRCGHINLTLAKDMHLLRFAACCIHHHGELIGQAQRLVLAYLWYSTRRWRYLSAHIQVNTTIPHPLASSKSAYATSKAATLVGSPSTKNEQYVEDSSTLLLREGSIVRRRYSFRSTKERSKEGSLCRPAQTQGNGGRP